MIFRILSASFLFCISFISVFSQGIRGLITNNHGEAVPFANIYIPQLSTGTTSNVEGRYDLKLPEGNWKVLFQYPYYQKQVSKYSCKVYLKGSGVFEKIPFLLEKQMKKGGVKENEAFVMETVSKIDFELPDKIKQQVLAMHSSGKDNNTSPMGMITNNLYDAAKYGIVSPVGKNAMKVYRFRLDGVFQDQGKTINKILVIPKTNGNDVFSGYIYIADVFWNIHSADLKLHIPMTDVKVHQLYAEVNKNTWMPVSLDFDMDFSGLGLKMKFRYVASITDYQTILNAALDHTFLDRLKNQQLQEQQMVETYTTGEKKALETREKSKAQKRIETMMQKPVLSNREAVKLNRLIEAETERNSPPEPLEIKSTFLVSQKQVNNDSAYWATLRPIPLTESERVSFIKKDSFLQVSTNPEFQDSLRDSKRKFKMKHLVVGKTYNYSIDSIKQNERFTIPSLKNPTLLSFNSVDGLRLELPFSYYKSDSTGRMKSFNPTFAYAFVRKKLDVEFSYQQRLNGMKNRWFSVSAGTATTDFNRISGLNTMTNDFYTIWLEENYKRFYRRDFLQLMTSHDLSNGLNLNVTLDYSENSPLTNHSSYSLIKYDDREIQPNIPANKTLLPWQLEKHQSLIGRLVLEYTPRHRYSIRNHTKIYAESKFPTYSLVYKGAFANVFGSDSRYDLLKIGMRQRVKSGIDEHLSYIISAGTFLNSSKVYFEEFQHFNTQPTGFMFNNTENSFRLLPFYEYSTQKSFIEAHGNWESRRLILKQLPIIKNSSFSENLFVNFLSTPELKNYTEVGYGLKQVFFLLNVEAVAGFENGKYRSAGVRVSLNLK
ncbi:MAG: hypothetical protein C0397_06265 [Odoribacter sp.]|nr:hypothetical protein [Odoribacter sp.]